MAGAKSFPKSFPKSIYRAHPASRLHALAQVDRITGVGTFRFMICGVASPGPSFATSMHYVPSFVMLLLDFKSSIKTGNSCSGWRSSPALCRFIHHLTSPESRRRYRTASLLRGDDESSRSFCDVHDGS